MRRSLHALAVATVSAIGLGALVGSAVATAPGPNGRIAFRRYLNPHHTRGAIFSVNPDGTQVRQITHPPPGTLDTFEDWSPDGNRLAFQRCPKNAPCGVYAVQADGAHVKALTPPCSVAGFIAGTCADGESPTWSPDGQWIAFQRVLGPFDASGNPVEVAIYVMRADGTQLRQVTQAVHPTTTADQSPEWSPDGTRLVFERFNFGVEPLFARAVWTVAVGGGDERQVTPFDLNAGDHPDWSPDGSLIVFRDNFELSHANVYTIHPDGTGLTQLTFGLDKHWAPAFSPDGTRITFSRSPSGPRGTADVFTMALDGSDVRQVTHSVRWDSATDWGTAPLLGKR